MIRTMKKLATLLMIQLLAGYFLLVSAPYALGESPLSGEHPDSLSEAVDGVIARIKPALVRIQVVSATPLQGREIKSKSVGSGVVFTPEGHVITNHHVVGQARRIICTLSNRKEIEAELVGSDSLADIAVIRLRTGALKELPFAQFGDSSELTVGDYVLAMGSPFAFSQSVTMGIVSNVELVMPKTFGPFNMVTIEGENVGSIVRWIGHDAAIYPGNSGGPLVNLKGEIVGINEVKMGISAAIPGNLAQDIARELIENGRVTRSWFGLEVQPLLKHSHYTHGALVGGTIESSPAEKAGFLPGDILLSVAGQEVDVHFEEEIPIFNQMMMGFSPGEEVEAMVLREGKKIALQMIPDEREYLQPKARELKQWGITASNISFLQAQEMQRRNTNGILVTSIRPGGPCSNAVPLIMKNDVIVEVDGSDVKKVEDMLSITSKITQSADKPLLVTFERRNERYVTVVKFNGNNGGERFLEVRKAWLPVSTQVLTKDIAKVLDIEGETGLRVTKVYAHSSAEKAGFKVGDIIVSLEGEKITATNPGDVEMLSAMVRQYKIGSLVMCTVLRDKKPLTLKVELTEDPNIQPDMKRYKDNNFEFTVRDMAFLDRARQNLSVTQKGALVEQVTPGGWASLAHLAVGDLILSVDDRSVTGVNSLEKIMKKTALEKQKSVVFHVIRGIHHLYIQLEPNWQVL